MWTTYINGFSSDGLRPFTHFPALSLMTQIKDSRLRKKPISDSDHVTIMFIRGADKLRSFSLSLPVLFGALIFFAIYVAFSILFINLYFSELRAGKAQSERLLQLQEQVRDTRETLEGASERLQLLEGRISGSPTTPGQSTASRQSDTPDASSVRQGFEGARQHGSVLDVQRFSARKDRQQLSIRFRLINIHPDNRPISGYVIMIAMNSETDPARYWTYPNLTLNDGVPVNFEDGEYFKIRNYRTVRGRYALENDAPPPTSIRILAYSESGHLLMKREMGLDV